MDYVAIAICVMIIGVLAAAVAYFAQLPEPEIPVTRTVLSVWSGVKFGFGLAIGVFCASIVFAMLGFSVLGLTLEQLFR